MEIINVFLRVNDSLRFFNTLIFRALAKLA